MEINPGKGLDRVGTLPEWSGNAVTQQLGQEGYAPRTRNTSPKHRRRVVEAAKLMNDVMMCREEPIMLQQAMTPTHPVFVEYLNQKYPGLFIQEARIGLRETMSYSDYSALTVDIVDRMLYEYYNVATIQTMPLVKKHPLRDFRLVARYAMDGMTKPFSRMPNDFPSLVPHGAGEPPTERAMQQAAREVLGSTQRVTYQPQLYQGAMSVNWRAIVNDDLGIFRDATQRLAISGNRTLMQFITMQYADANGWSSTIANSTFANLLTTANGASSNNPALNYQALLDAYTVLNKQLDTDGQPIDFNGRLFLVVGPALINTAISMQKATQVNISVGGGTGGTLSTPNTGFPAQQLVTPNWPMAGVEPIQDKYLPLICTAAQKNTMWALVYEPSVQPRPSVELGQLAGFETPQLFQKVPNTMRIGGGVDPMLGDFWTMNQEYKGVLVMGGAVIDGRSCVFSTGQGS